MMTEQEAEKFECIGPNRWDICYLAEEYAFELQKKGQQYIRDLITRFAPFNNQFYEDHGDIWNNEWLVEAQDIRDRLEALSVR